MGQHVHVDVAAPLRGRDHEKQPGGLPIGGVVVQSIGDRDGGQAGPLHRGAAGVGDGHPVAHGGGVQRLPCPDFLLVAFLVGDVPRPFVEVRQQVDDGGLVAGAGVELDGLWQEQIGDTHG